MDVPDSIIDGYGTLHNMKPVVTSSKRWKNQMNNDYETIKKFIMDGIYCPKLAPRCLETLRAFNRIANEPDTIPAEMLTCVNVTTDKIMAGCVDGPHYKS